MGSSAARTRLFPNERQIMKCDPAPSERFGVPE